MAVRTRSITLAPGSLLPLPRGRHGLSRTTVRRNQRERLLAAAVMAVSERGYAELAVRHVIERAGISRHTFYEHFDDRQEVVLVAYDESFAVLLGEIGVACASQLDWPSKVGEAIATALRLAAAEPATAALITIHAATAGREGAQRVLDSGRQLAALLAAARPDSDGRPGMIERTMVGAIWTAVATHLLAGEAERLPRLAPRLAELTLLPYRREQSRTEEAAQLT